MEFQKEGGSWVAEYTSAGDTVVQLERASSGWLNVYANMEGMEKMAIASWTDTVGGRQVLVKVCVPEGMTVTIESGSEVTAAKTLAV